MSPLRFLRILACVGAAGTQGIFIGRIREIARTNAEYVDWRIELPLWWLFFVVVFAACSEIFETWREWCLPISENMAISADPILTTDLAPIVTVEEETRRREALEDRIGELEACGGPISTEVMKLDELLDLLAHWKEVASGQTCVSFENLSYGSDSLWHQTHRENYRKIDKKPEALSRWVLDHANCVKDDFPAQVLEILAALKSEVGSLQNRVGELEAERSLILERLGTARVMNEIRSPGINDLQAENERLRGLLQEIMDSPTVRHTMSDTLALKADRMIAEPKPVNSVEKVT